MNQFLHAEIKEKKYGTIIALSGILSRATHKKLSFIFKEVVTDDLQHFALDLSKLEYMDAKGLEVIAGFLDVLKKKKIIMYAFGMNIEIYDILDMVDSARGITLVKSEKEFRKAISKALT